MTGHENIYIFECKSRVELSRYSSMKDTSEIKRKSRRITMQSHRLFKWSPQKTMNK